MTYVIELLTIKLTVIGRFGMAVTTFISLLLFIPNPLEGRLAIWIL